MCNNKDLKERRALFVGLTGCIGAGKSTVAHLLSECGAHVIDADRLSRVVTQRGATATQELVQLFGPTIVDAAGALDRKSLAARVFGDVEARRTVESIVHPAIVALMEQRRAELERSGARVIVYDAALLVETGRYRTVDALVVVVADEDVRMARVADRDEMAIDDIRARMAAQMPQSDKAALADYVIDNSATIAHTKAQVVRLWNELLSVLPSESKTALHY